MEEKLKFGGTNGYGDSYLEFLARFFNVFRQHATLNDAAEAVRVHSGKEPGYCYMIGRAPKSCLLGHVTGLLFCLYVTISLPSSFNSLTTTIKTGNLGRVWDKPVPDRWFCFCPKFCQFVDHLCLLFENSPLRNLWRINCLDWNFVQCSRILFTCTKIMKI